MQTEDRREMSKRSRGRKERERNTQKVGRRRIMRLRWDGIGCDIVHCQLNATTYLLAAA
jgi:hypothetical protein